MIDNRRPQALPISLPPRRRGFRAKPTGSLRSFGGSGHWPVPSRVPAPSRSDRAGPIRSIRADPGPIRSGSLTPRDVPAPRVPAHRSGFGARPRTGPPGNRVDSRCRPGADPSDGDVEQAAQARGGRGGVGAAGSDTGRVRAIPGGIHPQRSRGLRPLGRAHLRGRRLYRSPIHFDPACFRCVQIRLHDRHDRVVGRSVQ